MRTLIALIFGAVLCLPSYGYQFVVQDGVMVSGCCRNGTCWMLQRAQAAASKGATSVRIDGRNHPITYVTTKVTPPAAPVTTVQYKTEMVPVTTTEMVRTKFCTNGRCYFRNVPVTRTKWVAKQVPVTTVTRAVPVQKAVEPSPPKEKVVDITYEFDPTPEDGAQFMVAVARIASDETVIDLGCGDGRLLEYASPFAQKCVGVEINPKTVELAVKRTCDLENVTISKRDINDTDVSDADVVFVYLYPETPTMDRLIPRLRNLRLGSRIVSYLHDHLSDVAGFETEQFTMGDHTVFVSTVTGIDAVTPTFNIASQLAKK